MRKSRNFRILLSLVGILLLFCLNEFLVLIFGIIVRNTGVSFGLKFGGTLFGAMVMAGLGWWVIWRGEEQWLLPVWWGGGLNLIDRIRFGYVRDYWYLGFGLYNNLADWIIVLGGGCFLINLWMKKSK